MTTVGCTVTNRVTAPRSALFDWFILIDPPRFLHGHGPIPAITATSGQTGPWDAVGSARVLHLADGHTVHESVTDCRRPDHFAYRVSGFDGPLGRLVTGATGQWRFTDGPDGSTDIAWTYTFAARNRLAALVLPAVVRAFWRGFMRRSLARLGALADVEVGRPDGAPQ